METRPNSVEKTALLNLLTQALSYRGVRDKYGRPIPKYAFLSGEEAKKVKYLKRSGNVTIRVIGD